MKKIVYKIFTFIILYGPNNHSFAKLTQILKNRKDQKESPDILPLMTLQIENGVNLFV